MIDLETVEHQTFQPLVGQSFTTTNTSPLVSLKLTEVKSLGHRRTEAKRDPFALTLVGPPGLLMPQRIYGFDHPLEGSFDMFITQTGNGPDGSLFEAVFT